MDKIVKLGHPSLKIKSKKITHFDENLNRLVKNMEMIMYHANGVGLAAPQISKNIQLFVYDVGDGPKHCINPKVVLKSETSVFYEGCLSVPGYYFDISRPNYVKIECVNLDNQKVIHEGEALIGRVLQHEIDHLNGKLLLNRLKRTERKEAMTDIAIKGFPGPYEN